MMKIFLNCPQCGAEVNMEEDASAFRCEFCTSKLKPVGRKEVQSFYIAPNSTKETVGTALVNVLNRRIGRFKLKQAWLGYAPYWRVQGLLFQWSFGRRSREEEGLKQYDAFKELRAIKYDRSFPAFNYSKWEVLSLGLKTQFLKMRPYSRARMGPDALFFGLEIFHPQAVEIANRVPLSDKTLVNTRGAFSKSFIPGC
jgi:DNA-directed RNA polymerase subunit RPC12/RpoP